MQHRNKNTKQFIFHNSLSGPRNASCFNFILSMYVRAAKPYVLVYLPTDHSNLKKTD